MPPVLFLLVGTCLLLWLVMSAPIGRRTVRQRVVANVASERLWRALHPFGPDFQWNGAVTRVEATGATAGRLVTSHMGRDGRPIEREFAIADEVTGERFTLRYTNDTALAQSFWDNHVIEVAISHAPDGRAVAEIAETDNYRGIAFLVFRFFALRRQATKLKRWVETGEFKPGGMFEHPLTQFGMAGLSAMLMWPFFGLHAQGLFLAVTLTMVVGAHEAGHMLAFRIMGHQKARMIFLPLLGGIALGGRPYDKHFEIGFSALMGAGFSAFPVALTVWWHAAFMPGADGLLGEAIVIAALFNLGNLMPVWKFDGGQVLRQIFRTGSAQATAAFLMLGILMATGIAVGFSAKVMLLCGALLAMLSLITTTTGVKPKTELKPMTGNERLALLSALVAVTAIHAMAVVWAVRLIFY
ncbi:MAG: site-2 protease family protein [Oricola sp.]